MSEDNFVRLRKAHPRPKATKNKYHSKCRNQSYDDFINKIHVNFNYRTYNQWENKENVRHVRPPPRNPRFNVRLGWTITKLIHVLNYFQAHPDKSCSQPNHTNAVYKPQSLPNIGTKCLWTVLDAPHSSTKEASSFLAVPVHHQHKLC